MRKGGVGGNLVGPDTSQARAQGWPRRPCVWPPRVPLQHPFWLRFRYGKIICWVFVPCNSENISCTTFLKQKNSRKQELKLWHHVNRLVPKNAKYCIKVHIKHVGT